MNIARKIVGSLSMPENRIVEVGPGTGVLTGLLIQDHFDFIAIDIDEESIEYLKTTYPEYADKLIHDDFLKKGNDWILNPENKRITILGNFPYNISSQIFFKVLENRDVVDEVVGMVQKEVAERICAPPGNKTYGILSVLLQAFYHTEYLFTVSENVFVPPPMVKSAVLRLKRNSTPTLGCDEALFFKIVKKAFNQRRKILRNSLKEFQVEEDGLVDLTLRPEQLSSKEFVNIVLKTKSTG